MQISSLLLFFSGQCCSYLLLKKIKDENESEQGVENHKCGYITILIFGSMKTERLDFIVLYNWHKPALKKVTFKNSIYKIKLLYYLRQITILFFLTLLFNCRDFVPYSILTLLQYLLSGILISKNSFIFKQPSLGLLIVPCSLFSFPYNLSFLK